MRAAVAIALLAMGMAAPFAARAASPDVNYALHCMGCHRPDGSGAAGRVPNLAGLRDFLRVPGGREYLVRVPGTAFSALGDAETAALLNWMVRRFGTARADTPFARYMTAEVGALRQDPLVDVEEVRGALLRAIRELE